MKNSLMKDPVYCQLNGLLRGLIRSGEFRAGQQFLTERQIGERFGISRTTANKALSALVAEGALEFRKGVGTFVRSNVLDYDLRFLVSFTEKARAAGKKPDTKVLKFVLVPYEKVADDVRDCLQMRPTDKVWYIERLRLADDVPVILERRRMVARFCPKLTRRAVGGSLYEVLTERYKLDMSGADENIRAVSLGSEDARVLKAEPHSAALLVTAIGYVSGGVPLWHERTLFRGDSYEFRNRLGPVQAARPAAGAFITLGEKGGG
jgi:GntR family transcriptional regulator